MMCSGSLAIAVAAAALAALSGLIGWSFARVERRLRRIERRMMLLIDHLDPEPEGRPSLGDLQ